MAAGAGIRIGRLLYKIPLLLVIVFCYFVVAGVVRLACRGERRLRAITKVNSALGRTALRLLNMKVHIHGTWPRGRCFFIVSNHLSYIDPLVLFNAINAIFVTSVEVRENRLLGPLCRLSECYFVERRNKFNIKNEISAIGEYLRRGINVVLFPEATSTDGERILRFKTSFFQVAVDRQVAVLPVCLQYLQIDGEAITAANRDSLYWYGNIGFFAHLVLILSLRAVSARINILPTLSVAGRNKNELAALAQQRIEDCYFAKN